VTNLLLVAVVSCLLVSATSALLGASFDRWTRGARGLTVDFTATLLLTGSVLALLVFLLALALRFWQWLL